jgi:hypothetical protein
MNNSNNTICPAHMCESYGGYAVSALNFFITPLTNETTCGDCGQGYLCSYTCNGWTCTPSQPPTVTVTPPETLPIPFGGTSFLNIFA